MNKNHLNHHPPSIIEFCWMPKSLLGFQPVISMKTILPHSSGIGPIPKIQSMYSNSQWRCKTTGNKQYIMSNLINTVDGSDILHQLGCIKTL